jgi:hypothetical protein
MTKPVVTIYCDGPEDDRHDRWVVDQYERDIRGGWTPRSNWEYRGHSGRSAQSTVRSFIGETPEDAADFLDQEFRMQLAIRCPRCKFNELRNFDADGPNWFHVLRPVFDKMLDAGVEEIPARLLVRLIK